MSDEYYRKKQSRKSILKRISYHIIEAVLISEVHLIDIVMHTV